MGCRNIRKRWNRQWHHSSCFRGKSKSFLERCSALDCSNCKIWWYAWFGLFSGLVILIKFSNKLCPLRANCDLGKKFWLKGFYHFASSLLVSQYFQHVRGWEKKKNIFVVIWLNVLKGELAISVCLSSFTCAAFYLYFS